MPSIYIFDYDSDIVYVLCQWFSLNGFVTKGFLDAEELFIQLKEHQPDFIIMDCLFDGLAVTVDICKTLRNILHYNGKILLTSTSSFSEKSLYACGASDFITKPFDLSDVLNNVNKYLNSTST